MNELVETLGVLERTGALTWIITTLFLFALIGYILGDLADFNKLKALEAEQQKMCNKLLHLEQRYEESCPPISIAARYIMFSEFTGDDEDLALLDDLLSDNLPSR